MIQQEKLELYFYVFKQFIYKILISIIEKNKNRLNINGPPQEFIWTKIFDI